MRTPQWTWVGPFVAQVLCLIVAVTAVCAAAEAQQIVGSEDDADSLQLTELPGLLDAAAVRERLHSGLTNSFVFEVSLRMEGRWRPTGGGRIDLRWELWDELYLIEVFGWDGARSRHTARTLEGLKEWWRSARIPVLANRNVDDGDTVRVVATFVPFSAAEERSAEQWLVESAQSQSRSSDNNSGVLQVLVASSIARDAVLTRRWEARVTRRDPGG